MTDREARATRNQENSLAAFLAKKVEFDALLAKLAQASDDHFGADPESDIRLIRSSPPIACVGRSNWRSSD